MRSGSGWMGWIGAILVSSLPLVGGTAHAEGERATSAFSLDVGIGPAFYRYTESGVGMFDGLETEWEEIGVLVRTEGAWQTSLAAWLGEAAAPRFAAFLGFDFLTSAEDTETNNVGASTTDLRIAYLFSLRPGVRLPFRWFPGVTVSPEVSWDLDWYRQERELEAGGQVNESAFRHGPSAGVSLGWQPAPEWLVALSYRHAFLIGVEVSNTFAEQFGIDELDSDGQRDVVEIGVSRRFGDRWSAGVGYRFESARIEASRTVSRTIIGAAGLQQIDVQFPENDHRIHGALLHATFRF